MSREHGDAQISARSPRATAICDRCGRFTNLDRLQWQWDWKGGPRLFNLRILVCQSCLDVPQQNGRTIVLPPDPVPVRNPRPETYVGADNPVSGLGYSPNDNFIPGSSISGNIGNLTNNGGVDSAFFLVGQSTTVNSTSITALFSPNTAPLVNKRYAACAALSVSNSSFNNYVGKNWNSYPSGITISLPTTVAVITHQITGFTAYAPNDQSFLRGAATGWRFDGSNDNATWTTLSSGTTAGTAGETIVVANVGGSPYQFHRFNIQGDGISQVGIAGLSIAISDGAPTDI